MASEDNTFVRLDGDTYSVVEKPPRDSKAVVEARDSMLGTVDLDDILSNLVTVGKFIRIAYNGVAGDTELQITMRELGFEIAKLCDDSGLTIGKFRMTADSILTDLTGAYRFLLDDAEETAIAYIESVGDSDAKQMPDTAEQLFVRFEAEKEKVQEFCKETAEKKEMEEQTLKDLEKKEKEMMAEAERLAEEEKKLQKEIETATAEEEKLAKKLSPNAANVLGVGTLHVLPTLYCDGPLKAVRKNQVKNDRLHRMRSGVERRGKVLKEMEKCVEQIAQCHDKARNVHDQAIPALHSAVRALSSLVVIMRKAATFWKSMQHICEEQSNGKLEALLDTVRQWEDPKKRLRAYQSMAIKKHVVQKCVSWVAMEVICDDFIKEIKAIREELYSFLKKPSSCCAESLKREWM